jgi:beta-galactosidase
VVILACVGLAACGRPAEGRDRRNFDRGWKFHKGDVRDGQTRDFDDSGWRNLDLPHDWSIESRFQPRGAGGWRGGFAELGTGWYRKRFEAPADTGTRKACIEFDGVYKDSDVWLNGKHLGKRWYGYAAFRYDMTPHINWGGDNVVAVRAYNPKQTCRWYSGCGIYRHVWLTYTDKLAVGHWGTFVTTPEVSAASATVRIETTVTNGYDAARPVMLKTEILDPRQRTIASIATEANVDAEGKETFEQKMAIREPSLWSAKRPSLYTARTVLESGGRPVDRCSTPFGIREIEWSAESGFVVNGETVPINGVNLHHDLGSLGAAFNDRAMERRLEVLKGMGCNAIRTSHNPPAAEMLDMCDRMGFYVMDEAFDKWLIDRRHATFEQDWRKDLLAMILRDRNHPSVVIWSVGNENWAPRFPQRKRIYTQLRDLARKHDDTRKFTYALSPGNFVEDARIMDVVSLNYQEHKLDMYREGRPDMVIVASESTSGLKSGHLGLSPWLELTKHPFAAGSFIFAGIDYLGEARGKWPWRGVIGTPIDTCGFRKPASYLHESFWSDRPMVHVAVTGDALPAAVKRPGARDMVSHWTLPGAEGRKVRIITFSNCDEVELVANGKSLGRKRLADFEDRMICWEDVPYAAGSVRATGLKAGEAVASHEIRTAGPAKRIELAPDRSVISADGQDLSHVVVRIVDAKGELVPGASHEVLFDVSGAGRLRAVDNGDLASLETYAGTSRSAYFGRCMAIVQADTRPGTITLRASAAGLEPAEVTLESR